MTECYPGPSGAYTAITHIIKLISTDIESILEQVPPHDGVIFTDKMGDVEL